MKIEQALDVLKRQLSMMPAKQLSKALIIAIECMEASLPRISTDLLIHGWTDEQLQQYHNNVGELLTRPQSDTETGI